MRTTSPAQSRYKTRQAYLDATLELIHSAGVENLSMRKVARHLGVSPMAAYKHFANKDELMAAALDVFISQADVYPPQHLPWDQWMLYLARGMHRALAGEAGRPGMTRQRQDGAGADRAERAPSQPQGCQIKAPAT